jgi:hypothetical protein
MKQLTNFLFFVSFLCIYSCEDIFECIINRRPELANKTLAIAHVDQFYSEVITADIKNEPYDDGYDYYFNIEGQLPRGIEYYIEYRKVILEGIPLVSGNYNFKVRLSVVQIANYNDECESRFNDCDGLCEKSTSKEYTLLVN